MIPIRFLAHRLARTLAKTLAKTLAPVIAALALALAGPAAAQQAADPLAQEYEPAPAIWRLADEDTTIYLFGTIHLLPRGFRWRNAQFNAIVEQADTLVLESSDADAQASLARLAPKIDKVTRSRPATSQQLAPTVRNKWRMLVEASGASFEEVDTMPLPLAILGFGADSATGGQSRYEYGVETVLQREFARAGKPIGSIESHGGVMLALMRIDEGAILRDLEADLAAWSGKSPAGFGSQRGWLAAAGDWSMEHAWAQGQVQEDFDLGLGDGKLGAAFRRVLLDRRNTAWAAWLDNRLEQPGTLLVAVGAGHFEGPDSVLAKLQARGLQAERIN